MILRRVTAALRRQDWTMVAIEFVLVVLGVLLGFQINEWANRRAADAERRTSTERLLEEAELTVAYNGQAVDFERRLLQDLTFAGERIAARKWPKTDQNRITAGLARARTMVALAPPSSVYDDVVSSGHLNEIGNVTVRAAISRYRATLSFEERMRERLEVPLTSYERIPAFQYQVPANPREHLGLLVDFPNLLADRQAQQALALTTESHRIVLVLRTRALKDSERMCIALATVVGRACNRDVPPPKYD